MLYVLPFPHKLRNCGLMEKKGGGVELEVSVIQFTNATGVDKYVVLFNSFVHKKYKKGCFKFTA